MNKKYFMIMFISLQVYSMHSDSEEEEKETWNTRVVFTTFNHRSWITDIPLNRDVKFFQQGLSFFTQIPEEEMKLFIGSQSTPIPESLLLRNLKNQLMGFGWIRVEISSSFTDDKIEQKPIHSGISK